VHVFYYGDLEYNQETASKQEDNFNENLKKNAVYTNAIGDILASKTAKIIKGDVSRQHVRFLR